MDPTLLAEVQRFGRFDASCLNCGGCSIACDLTVPGMTFPRRPIRLAVLGLRSELSEALEPWLCEDCGDCTVACPRQADPADSMRTLRRFLTAQYDPTGIASRVLRSRAAHTGALVGVGLLVLAIALVYHLRWAGLGLPELTQPMGLEHMFGKIVWFTWIVYALALAFLAVHAGRMIRFVLRREAPPARILLSAALPALVEMFTQGRLRMCRSEAHQQRLHAGEEAGEPVYSERHRWIKHWLMVLGVVTFLVLTAFFLRWFQTDAIHPLWHPQRWIGYAATFFILWATSDILLRRWRTRRDPFARRTEVALPLLLWLTAVSGLLVHVFRYAGLALSAHFAYAVHLAICVSLLVVEVPFGEWAHMIDRPLAVWLQIVKEKAREAHAKEGALPAPAPA